MSFGMLDLKGKVSGFCDVGSHEGTRAKSYTGIPLKTCPFWMSCGCDCHKEVTRMFEMSGQERIEVPNPEYRPYQRTFWMPSDDPNYGLPKPQEESIPDDKLQITPTGRVRKGGLEIAVQRVVLAWMELPVMERIDGLAVKNIAERVYENEGAALDKPPSLGAVAAVLDRWVTYGYVLLGQKPVRVISLTKEGKENGLDWCRARFKNEKAS
jgi:hypothetical protein